MTLEEQLRALCDQHGLNNLSVDITILPSGTHFFGAYAHRNGKCGSAAVFRETPMEAASEAITNVLAKCGVALIDVPELVAA